jgi:CheY-like chemotaxis protein
MKVLIVDDNDNDRKILKYNFKQHGCEVILEARNGKEGLALARMHKPDLIVSDGLMPVMDGFHLLRFIKKDEELKSIPFIFYSAIFDGSKEIEFATSLGATKFIVKPVGPEEFWEILKATLEEIEHNKEIPTDETDNEEDNNFEKDSS